MIHDSTDDRPRAEPATKATATEGLEARLEGALVGLAAIALLSSYLPARRAARIDPMSALRGE